MDRLENSVKYYHSIYGRLDVKWGDIQRLKRGDTDLPLSRGRDILRAISSQKQNGPRKAIAGDCFSQIGERTHR